MHGLKPDLGLVFCDPIEHEDKQHELHDPCKERVYSPEYEHVLFILISETNGQIPNRDGEIMKCLE